MLSRWYSISVLVFWIATMSWLIQRKVLPPLIVGEPPTYRTILADTRSAAAVGWTISMEDQPLGVATSTLRRLDDGSSQIHSQMRLTRLPLAELTPGWMKSLLRLLDVDARLTDRTLALDADSRLEIDPLGRPVAFNSKATFTEQRPRQSLHDDAVSGFDVVMQGVVDGRYMKVKLRSGDFFYNSDVFLPTNALMSDVFSPQSQLPGLRVGQTWTVPVYSPLGPPGSPMEILQATVERDEPLVWNGQVVSTRLVVFRGNPGSGLTSDQAPKARAWVDRDGNVLRQELVLLSARLSFERMPDDQVPPRAAR
ncbi:MAG: hypothetical protein WD847_00790 [Pirellulales bacterium]